jgi:putative pyruvate formate lyase activating enzyme
MNDFDGLHTWLDEALSRGLAWYREVAANRRPAKSLIAATIRLELDPAGSDEPALWAELKRATALFQERHAAIRDGARLDAPTQGPSLLELCGALADRMLRHCDFCAWNCRVDRSRGGKLGACKLEAGARVSSWFHHPGEELVYRGTRGSGTIFFTSCNMRCAFCQNGDISTDKDNGEEVDARVLAGMAWLLRAEGCHNVNWVGGEPTIHLHRIVEAIALLGRGYRPSTAELRRALPTKADRVRWFGLNETAATHDGRFNAPMLWNSNFFMSERAMRLLRVLIDVWLPDLKFGPGRCAIELARTPRYWETVTANLLLLREWGEDLTIRHLVMPGHVDCCTRPVLDWLAGELPGVPVNIMDQYHPDNFCDAAHPAYRPQYAPLTRRPTRGEILAAYEHAARLGLPFERVSFD